MKIVLAPDSFKGSLGAPEVCDAMARGLRRAMPEVEVVSRPMADGGEGTLDAVLAAVGERGTRAHAELTGAAGDRVRASFDVEDATGRIKRADVSVDGGAWREVFPDDGIADSQRERFSLDLPITGAGEHTISLRAYDNSNNVGSVSVIVRR